MRTYEAKPTESIDRAAAEMVRLAKRHCAPVHSTFNGVSLTAYASNDPGVIVDAYYAACNQRDLAKSETAQRAIKAFEPMKESIVNLMRLVESHTGANDAVANAAIEQAAAVLRLAEGDEQ